MGVKYIAARWFDRDMLILITGICKFPGIFETNGYLNIKWSRKMSIRSGNMVGGDSAHPATGVVTIVGNTVNLVDVQISEAPDGRVILAKDFDSTTGVRLGNLKGFTGSHDYSIPEETDIDSYNTVLVWCDQFNVPIGKVKL